MNRKVRTRNYKRCVICKSWRLPNSGLFLARLPLEPTRCRMWVKAIGQTDLVHVPIEKLHELKHVCGKHFKPEDFNCSNTRLRKHAIPTEQLNADPLDDGILQDFPLHVGQDNEQNVPPIYVRKIVPVDVHAMTSTGHREINSNPSTSSSTTTKKSSNAKVPQRLPKIVPVVGEPDEHAGTSTQGILQEITNFDPDTSESTKQRSNVKGLLQDMKQNNPGTSTSSKKRSYVKGQGLTTKEQKLLSQLQKTKLSLRKLSRTSVDLEKLDNEILKSLISDAIKNHKKKPTGKRWTLKTKVWALAILKRSPKAYRYLECALPVPGVKTLKRLIKKVPLEPGINKKIINKLTNLIKNFSAPDRHCALLFDEMALKKNLYYNEGTDKIEGFEDFGNNRSDKIADHALVFMVQGLRKKYKQPVAYYFTKGTVSSQALLSIIKELVECLHEVGLNVITTVCDQGPTNVGALNLLKKFGGQCPEDNYFKFKTFKIHIMFDVPHLFKSIRNNFYNAGEIHYNGKVGKWSHLIEAEERNHNFLNFRKITKNVVHPSYKIKMRVKYAAHALSHTMSAVLKMLSWKHTSVSKEILETAEIIEELDKLFDFCNGPSSPRDIKKGLRENVTKNTNHLAMWRYFLNRVGEIKFLKTDSKLQLQNVRCVNGFKISLKSLIDIWLHLHKDGFRFLNLRQLNQDSLENLFGVIRQHSPTNCNPTCTLFTAALKSSILSGFTAPHSRGSNCEKDDNKLIFNFNDDVKLAQSKPLTSIELESTNPDKIDDENVPVLSLPDLDDTIVEADLCSFENQPVVYVSGFLASKLIKRFRNCEECTDSLTTKETNDEMYKYTSLREWWQDKKSLTYPSNELCQTVNLGKSIFEKNLIGRIFEYNIRELCLIEFSVNLNLSWYKCHTHDINELFKYMATLFIRQHCRLTNDQLADQQSKTADFIKKAQQGATK